MTVSEGHPGAGPAPKHPQGPRYLLLTGAKLNAGDFLIRRRCEELLGTLRPDARLQFHDRWLPIDPEQVSDVDAVLLAGGPALQPRVYPDIYPLTGRLDRIRVSIIAWGLGWKGTPGDAWTERSYGFTARSRQLLERVQRDDWPISCRDPATARVLDREGFGPTILTGDPAWYDPDQLGQPFRPPRGIGSIVLSVPASPDYFPQARQLARRLRDTFPPADICCSFNHGWSPGPHLPEERARTLVGFRYELERDGFAVVDVSGGVEPLLELSDRFDLHVGYRLHTHLLFLSRRQPSLLVAEDGRGRAAGEALGLPGVAAWRRPAWARAVLRVIEAGLLPEDRLVRGVQSRTRPDVRAVDRILEQLARHDATAYRAYGTVADRIDTAYVRAMKPFIESLP